MVVADTVATFFIPCFKFLTNEGEKNIEDIKVGDKVLSKNEETGEVAYKEVTATFNHETDEIYQVHVGDQIIESTYNHPFWVDGKGWTYVKDLKVGDLLVQSDGKTLKIESIELLHKQVTVYNMTVDEFHTYFVSDLGIWVHNTNCSISSMFPNLDKKYAKHAVEYAEVFPNMTKEEFANRAINLATTPANGKTVFCGVRARDGAVITYNSATNEIVFVKNGVVDTFFRPSNGKAYFDAQFN